MDIKRPGKSKLKKRIRNGVVIFVGLVAVGGITYGLTKLKPAAPTLDRSTAVIDTVKRGQMLRQVRGNGTLVPQLTRWVPAPADGRVGKNSGAAGRRSWRRDSDLRAFESADGTAGDRR